MINLYKKGEPDNPTNYRPPLLHLSKIFEKLYKAHMEDYLHATKLLINRQFGFSKYFTVDALVYLTQRVRKELIENKFNTCAFRDLSKAFESINHTILLKN